MGGIHPIRLRFAQHQIFKPLFMARNQILLDVDALYLFTVCHHAWLPTIFVPVLEIYE